MLSTYPTKHPLLYFILDNMKVSIFETISTRIFWLKMIFHVEEADKSHPSDHQMFSGCDSKTA